MAQPLLNSFIYDNSQTHRNKLEKIIWNHAERSHIKLGVRISTTCPNKILNLSRIKSGLYFISIDDLEKKMDVIKFAINIRNNDLHGSIVFLTEHDIFVVGRSSLAISLFKSHVAVMSFLPKASAQYEKEIIECIAVHIRKISLAFDM